MRRSASFPQTIEALSAYDAIILSDIGANTLLLHPDTWIHSKTHAEPPAVCCATMCSAGGGLLMFGGYYSFQGINGGARYHKTPVEDVLPVTCLPDRRPRRGAGRLRAGVERIGDHPILKGLGADWPILLGFNEVTAEGRGRSSGDRVGRVWLAAAARHRHATARAARVAWTSDVGPHWLPPEFIAWDGYKTAVRDRCSAWATGED